MTKKKSPDEVGIELDSEYQKLTEEKLLARARKTDTDFERDSKLKNSDRNSATIVLDQVLSNHFEYSFTLKTLLLISKVLGPGVAILDFFVLKHGGLSAFFFPGLFIVWAIRPYLLLSLFTLFLIAFTTRLWILSGFRELMHAVYLARPESSKLVQVEKHTRSLNLWNQVAALFSCVFGYSTAFSLVGWEPGLTVQVGWKACMYFCIGIGFLIWVGAHKLFTLKER